MIRLSIALFSFFLFFSLFPLSAAGLELTNVSIRFDKFHHSTRHPMFRFGESMKESISIDVGINIIWKFHFDNYVHGESTNRQFRGVGWKFRLRFQPWQWVDVGYEHHSRHWLDMDPLFPGFPVQDSIFIRLNLLGTPSF
jgi:hypothetical protein